MFMGAFFAPIVGHVGARQEWEPIKSESIILARGFKPSAPGGVERVSLTHSAAAAAAAAGDHALTSSLLGAR